jgi:histone H3/H4
MVMALISRLLATGMKESERMMRNMVKALSHGPVAAIMKESGKMI